MIEVFHDETVLFSAPAFVLEVSDDLQAWKQAAAEIMRGASPPQAAHRIAWLREQRLPRFGMARFRVIMRSLVREKMTSPNAGRNVMRLRWNARLAAYDALPSVVRDAEVVAMRNLIATCGSEHATAQHVLCVGRTIDQLRRLGYLKAVLVHTRRALAIAGALPPLS